MKAIFIILCCLFAANIQAQDFVIKIEQLNGSVRYDTFDFQHPGKYVGCIIPDQYETVTRLPIDTFPDIEPRVLSYEFLPPQYDSTIQTIEVRPAYSFYEVNPNIKLPKGVNLIPPTWEIQIKSSRPESYYLGYIRIKEISSEINDNNCLSFAFTEIPSYVTIYKRVLKSPALLVQKIGNKTLTDTLKFPSNYLKEVAIPARYIQITKYEVINHATVQVKSSLPNAILSTRNRRLVREGMFSDIRQFYIGCFMSSDSTIAAVQKSLKEKGYRVKINDRVDRHTKKALIAYQLKYDLPVGYLNLETMRALDINRFTTYPERRRLNTEVECGIKNTKISDDSLIDDLIRLQALPDSEISERAHCGLKTVKIHRKALKIKEVKRQTIAFMK
jgi:hypothetical protein